MLSDQADELLREMPNALGPAWTCTREGSRVAFVQHRYAPLTQPRRRPSWADLHHTLERSFADHGVARGRLLPLRGRTETDFTISAVQALDPYLKQQQPFTYSSGYLPQPVVRLTGDRDEYGQLRPGFLTAFVNVSCVRPIDAVADHAELIDTWLYVLSCIGFNVRHIEISGTLDPWRRGDVCGITLRFRHQELTIGDAVLLWNAIEPSFLATDIGSGLERLRWALVRDPWHDAVLGPLAGAAEFGTIDAIRTGTLIAGSGIRPSSRGPGGWLRRSIRAERENVGLLGMSRVVRLSHQFWSLVDPLPTPWPDTCRLIEAEAFDDP